MSKSATYEVTPVRLRIPAANNLAEDTLSGGKRTRSDWLSAISHAPTRGVSTLPTNLQWAADRREGLIAVCERLIKARDLPALYRIIEANPGLALDHSIRGAVLKLSEAARFRNGPGRKTNSHERHPLLIVALVSDLMRAGKNLEQAFDELHELGISNHEAAHRQYHRARADPRFRGLLIELGRAQSQSAEGAETVLQAGERLRPGGQIRKRPGNTVLTRSVSVAWSEAAGCLSRR